MKAVYNFVSAVVSLFVIKNGETTVTPPVQVAPVQPDFDAKTVVAVQDYKLINQSKETTMTTLNTTTNTANTANTATQGTQTMNLTTLNQAVAEVNLMNTNTVPALPDFMLGLEHTLGHKEILSSDEIHLESRLDMQAELAAFAQAATEQAAGAVRHILTRLSNYASGVDLYRTACQQEGTGNLQLQLAYALCEATAYFDAFVDTKKSTFARTAIRAEDMDKYNSNTVRFKEYYLDVLDTFMLTSKNPLDYLAVAESVRWGLDNIHNQFRLVSDEQIAQMSFKNPKFREALLEKTYINLPEEPVTLKVRFGGIYMTTTNGQVFTYADHTGRPALKPNGEVFTTRTTRAHSYLLTKAEITADLMRVTDRINFHTKVSTLIDNSERISYGSNPVNPVGSKLNKIMLLKASGVDYIKLTEAGKQDYRKVVSVDETGKIAEVSLPTSDSALLSYYVANTGLIGASEAIAGYVAPLASIPGLAQLATENGQIVMKTVEQLNKAMARHQKLNLGKGTNIGKIRVMVVLSDVEYYSVEDGKVMVTPMSKAVKRKAIHDFGPSTLVMTEALMNRIGLCRITSTMSEGGLKTVTTYKDGFDNHNMVGPNAFKGGMVNLAMLHMKQKYQREFTLSTVEQGNIFHHMMVDMINNTKMVQFGDYMVQVLELDLELKITNAYTVENYKYAGEDLWGKEENIDTLQYEMDEIVSAANQKTSALSNKLLSRIESDPTFNVMQEIDESLAKGIIVEKEIGTRLTASSWEPVSLWHTRSSAENLVSYLHKLMTYEEAVIKTTTAAIMSGKFNASSTIDAEGKPKEVGNIIRSIDFKDIIRIVKEMDPVLNVSVNTYPKVLLSLLDAADIFGGLLTDHSCNKEQFIELVMQDGHKQYVPAFGPLLYTERAIKSDINFLATGFLKEILTAAKACVTATFSEEQHETRTIEEKSINGEGIKLESRIQGQLFGKRFGYLPAHGTYLVAVNDIGNYDIKDAEVRTTNTQLMVLRDGTATTSVLRSKFPIYHKMTFASAKLVHHTFGNRLADIAFSKAGVVSANQMFSKGDDFDGDLFQVIAVHEYIAEQFAEFSCEFNAALGTSFKKIATKEAEASICSLTDDGKFVLKFHTSTLEQVQQAIVESASASKNIGLFTSAKYQIESALSQVEDFTVSGSIMTLDDQSRGHVNDVLAYLCQTESMDLQKKDTKTNQKIEFIMSLVSPSKINKISGTQDEIIKQRNVLIGDIAVRINELTVAEGWKLDSSFGRLFASACMFAADMIKEQGMANFTMFSNTRVIDNRRKEITETLGKGWNLVSHDFNMTGASDRLSLSADSESMFAYLANVLMNTNPRKFRKFHN